MAECAFHIIAAASGFFAKLVRSIKPQCALLFVSIMKGRSEMKSFQITLRASILVAIGGLLIVVAPQAVQAQICPGSHLTYIVRDAHGVAIDAASKGLHYDPDNGSPNRKWRSSSHEFIRSDEMQVPDSVKKVNGKMAVLETEGMCTFKQPVKLQLTLEGKTMNLTFLMPKLDEYDSRDFLVDSLPFRQGTFEIELAAEESGKRSRLYPASGWKKVK